MKQNFTVRKGALDGIEAFLKVAQHRNFRRAAAELGVTPSAIGQAVRALEARLGTTLFMRTTRSVGLTEAGERFFARARPAFEELVAAGADARELGQGPSGLLRLSVPPSVIPILIEPLLATFSRSYPGIEVEISADAERVDLAAGGFDAGIRMGQFIDTDMVAVPMSPPFRFFVVGSPAYFADHPAPRVPGDLRQHACLRLRRSNGELAAWAFEDRERSSEIAVSGPFIANDFPTLLNAAAEGLGLAQVPEPVATNLVAAGKLLQVLEAYAPAVPGVFLYYPGRHQVLPKLRAFIDHVLRQRGV